MSQKKIDKEFSSFFPPSTFDGKRKIPISIFQCESLLYVKVLRMNFKRKIREASCFLYFIFFLLWTELLFLVSSLFPFHKNSHFLLIFFGFKRYSPRESLSQHHQHLFNCKAFFTADFSTI